MQFTCAAAAAAAAAGEGRPAGRVLEQPVRIQPAVCLQIAFSPLLLSLQPDWILTREKRRFLSLVPRPTDTHPPNSTFET